MHKRLHQLKGATRKSKVADAQQSQWPCHLLVTGQRKMLCIRDLTDGAVEQLATSHDGTPWTM